MAPYICAHRPDASHVISVIASAVSFGSGWVFIAWGNAVYFLDGTAWHAPTADSLRVGCWTGGRIELGFIKWNAAAG